MLSLSPASRPGEPFREVLRLCRELAVLIFARLGRVGLAALAAVHDDAQRSARLLGAAAAHSFGEGPTPDKANVEATRIQPVRARYGTGLWDDAAREGAALASMTRSRTP